MNVDKPYRKLQKEYERELGDDYKFDDKKLYMVANDQKYDIIPELLDGKNVADYIDPDIFEKLEALEREEELREAAGVYDEEIDDLDSEEEENRKLADECVLFYASNSCFKIILIYIFWHQISIFFDFQASISMHVRNGELFLYEIAALR